MLLGAYNFLDLTPKGRNEKGPMDWVLFGHDWYGTKVTYVSSVQQHRSDSGRRRNVSGWTGCAGGEVASLEEGPK